MSTEHKSIKFLISAQWTVHRSEQRLVFSEQCHFDPLMTELNFTVPKKCNSIPLSTVTSHYSYRLLPYSLSRYGQILDSSRRLSALNAGDQAWAMVEVPLRRKNAKALAENLGQQRCIKPQCRKATTKLASEINLSHLSLSWVSCYKC